MSKGWRCRTCLTVNQPRTRKCGACLKARPRKRRPAHMQAKLSYEEHASLNGGEFCGICGRVPEPGGRKLHRDHDHTNGGKPRGLLCFRDNAALRTYMTLEWVKSAVKYLERFDSPTVEENDAQHERTVSGTRKPGTEKQQG